MVVTKTVSTNGSAFMLSGTYADVIQAIEDEGIPQNQLIGMCYQGTAGSCAVLVKRH